MASIFSINKHFTTVYVTDTMGIVQFMAEVNRDGVKKCYIKRHDQVSPDWRNYGVENFDTIVRLTKHQIYSK